MEKIVLIPLFIIALFTALFYVARNKQPRTSTNKGLKGKFWFAVAFFAVIFGCKPGGTTTGKDNYSGGSVSFSQKTPDLSQMKLLVRKIFKNASFSQDWQDPGIDPNLNKILHELGILKKPVIVKCYSRSASPVQDRSAELVQLQKKLLDKKVKAGVLSVEQGKKVAGKSKRCNASDKEARNYQRKIKRLVRLLYKNGELPSSIVNKLEMAINCKIINFSPARKLVNDVTYDLVTLPSPPTTKTVLKILRKHKIINKSPNHRGLMNSYGSVTSNQQINSFESIPHRKDLKQSEPKPLTPEQKKIKKFKALLKSSQPVKLQADGNQVVKFSEVPTFKREYRLKVRKAVRALLKAKLANLYYTKHIEKTLGVPILGNLDK